MAHLLQQLLAPFDANAHEARDASRPPIEDDVALGCECANPALQFESWEPAGVSQGCATSY